MKVKELLHIWLNKYTKNTVKIKTFITYQNICDKHLIPELGNYKVKKLTTSILQDFIQKKIEKVNIKTGKELSINTVKSIISVLKQAFKLACNLEIIDKNITDKLSILSTKEKKTNVFNETEQKKLESFCLNNKKSNYIGIVICLYTGIRIGELLALTWDDIDFDKSILSINKSVCTIKLNNKTTLHIDEPKTKSSNRIIPIPKQLLSYLRKIKRKSNSIYVITTNNNKMVGTRSYQKSFERILKRLNIKYRNFHTLRHTFATRALELGMDVKALSEILGHSNPSITLNRYVHSLFSYKKDMMNKLGKNILN